jgi:hypothetical protein
VLRRVEADEGLRLQDHARIRAFQLARRQQHHRLRVERGPHQVRARTGLAHGDRRIERARLHAFDQLDRLRRRHVQVERRMPALQRQRRLDQRPHCGHDRAQVHRARHRIAGRGRRQHLFVQAQQAAHLRHQLAARVVEHHALALAREQRAAQLGLERAHLLADGGLGEGDARGGGGERSFAGDGREGLQEADAAHASS